MAAEAPLPRRRRHGRRSSPPTGPRWPAGGSVDFDEQIYRAVELLLTDPEVRARARAGCRTLLVDEFQDLTPAHVLLVRLLAGPAASVFGVGDDDQAIYGYAGADPGFLIDFARYFPGAATYDLTVNYRCPPAIVGAARDPARPQPPAHAQDDLRRRPAGTADAGALVVQPVRRRRPRPAALDRVMAGSATDVEPTDVAVLTRVNSSLLPVQVLLAEAGIPYSAAVGPWLLERPGIAAALAYLRMGSQPAASPRTTCGPPCAGRHAGSPRRPSTS